MSQELLLVVGYPASGKSSEARRYVDQGYARLNRDEAGGTSAGLLPELRRLLKGGKSVVVDNTFPTVESRRIFIEEAKKAGVPARCLWMATSIEDAQFNACQRMVRKYGKLFGPDEYKGSKDPNMFPPVVQFKYRNDFEQPSEAEGFSALAKVRFARKADPGYSNKALFLDFDQTLRDVPDGNETKFPTKPGQIKILPGRSPVLQSYQKNGYLLLGVSNQSGVAKGDLTASDAVTCFDYTISKLNVKKMDYLFCPHKVPPISCWCRKPMPGMGALMVEKYKLDPKQCIMVGDQKTDETFAKRCGFRFIEARRFFA